MAESADHLLNLHRLLAPEDPNLREALRCLIQEYADQTARIAQHRARVRASEIVAGAWLDVPEMDRKVRELARKIMEGTHAD